MKIFDKDWWSQQLYKEQILESDEVNELGIGNQNKLKAFSTYSTNDKWVPRGIFIYFKRNNSTNWMRIEGYMDADGDYIKFETLGSKAMGEFFKCLNIPFKENNEIISINYTRFLIKDLKDTPSNQDRNEWYNQIPENINELEISPRHPQIGQQYDLKVWWGSDDWNYNKYLQKVFEPTDGTVGGEEGWYWSKYWTYGKKFPDGAIGFYEENGDVADYVPGETIFRKSRLNELNVNKPNQYIPIIKLKEQYININQIDKFINIFENTNLKIQNKIGKLDISAKNEIKGNIKEFNKLPFLTANELGRFILREWLYGNTNNFYYTAYRKFFDKWWNESRIDLEELNKIESQSLDELNVNPNRIKFPLIIKNQEEYNKLAPILDKQGYIFYGGLKATEWNNIHSSIFPMYLELEGNKMFTPSQLYESQQPNNKQIFKEFIQFCFDKLQVTNEKPKITLTKNKSKTTSFAHYDPNNKEIIVYIKNRNILDICRSLAHECKHWEQDIKGQLTSDSGTDGSDHENEANSFAGIVLREFGRKHPELYTVLVENKQLNELNVNPGNRTWDLNKPGVKFENIKPGDIIAFNLYDTDPPTLAKQVVNRINPSNPNQLITHDLGNEKAIDFWGKSDIENYLRINELNINSPNYNEERIEWIKLYDELLPLVQYHEFEDLDDVENRFNIIYDEILDYNKKHNIEEPPTLYGNNSWYKAHSDFEFKYQMNYNDLIKFFKGLKQYRNKTTLNELEINPTHIKFPLKVNKEQYFKLAPILTKKGYMWLSTDTPLEWNPWDNIGHSLNTITITNIKKYYLLWKPNTNDLDEGMYGDYLFGDKTSGAEFYGGHKETDINKESNLFKQLKKYVTGYKKEYSEIDLSNLVTLFHKLRKEYPEIVDPKLDKEAYIYRGTYMTQEQLDNYSKGKDSIEYDQGYIINNITYNSRRKVQSWSTDYYNAATFAASRHKEGIPVIIRVKVKDADLFWNPHFINLINGFKEDEVLNTKLPLKADLMVVNLDKFEDEETFELSKYINIPK